MKHHFFSILLLLLLGPTCFGTSHNDFIDKPDSNQGWTWTYMLGLGAQIHTPKNYRNDGHSDYVGHPVEFAAIVRKTQELPHSKGPSQLKVYTNVNVLRNFDDPSDELAFLSANLGLNAPFERFPTRQYLIPFIGTEIGGLYQSDYSSFQITPTAGLHVYSNKYVLCNLQIGYKYAFRRFSENNGMVLGLMINASLWP